MLRWSLSIRYTGEGCVVPKCVTIVRFHPSVIEVEYEAFGSCSGLKEVVFNDGLQKIGQATFWNYTTSLGKHQYFIYCYIMKC